MRAHIEPHVQRLHHRQLSILDNNQTQSAIAHIENICQFPVTENLASNVEQLHSNRTAGLDWNP